MTVMAERPFGFIVLVENIVKYKSNVYLTFDTEPPCTVRANLWRVIGTKTGYTIRQFGITPNITGYTHFWYWELLVPFTACGRRYLVNATLDNLGVTAQHTFNISVHQEDYMQCFENAYITNAGNFSSPAVIEYTPSINFAYVIEWDQPCLTSYNASPVVSS